MPAESYAESTHPSYDLGHTDTKGPLGGGASSAAVVQDALHLYTDVAPNPQAEGPLYTDIAPTPGVCPHTAGGAPGTAAAAATDPTTITNSTTITNANATSPQAAKLGLSSYDVLRYEALWDEAETNALGCATPHPHPHPAPACEPHLESRLACAPVAAASACPCL